MQPLLIRQQLAWYLWPAISNSVQDVLTSTWSARVREAWKVKHNVTNSFSPWILSNHLIGKLNHRSTRHFTMLSYLWRASLPRVNHLGSKTKEQPCSEHRDNAISNVVFDIYQHLWGSAVTTDQMHLSFHRTATTKANNRHQHICWCSPLKGSQLISFLRSSSGGKTECNQIKWGNKARG